MGATVYLTRDNDYDLSSPNAYLRKRSDLSNRVNMINSSNADIYLSIHLNSSSNSSWKGAQVFYDDINEKNKEYARVFQNLFSKYLNSDRSIKEINSLYMYRKITKPGLLLELGFISNPKERKLLVKDEYQDKIVEILSQGVLKIF